MFISFTNSINSGVKICPSLIHVSLAVGLALYGHLNEIDADVG
jgi:hypothetical protein